jgi:hypothetical protein
MTEQLNPNTDTKTDNPDRVLHKEWIGFTDVERSNLAMGVIAQVQTVGANMAGITNAILFIEEKLQEKNT